MKTKELDDKIKKDCHGLRPRNDKKQRVVCAMSGGVDSSVAAALLKEQGFEVIGIFMKLWAEERVDKTDLVRENICCSVEASTAARAVAEKLGIPFYVVNFEKEFRQAVVQYYIDEYESGRTPNPCVICNRDIKGELLLKKATELGADYLATGHYARVEPAVSNVISSGSEKSRDLSASPRDDNKIASFYDDKNIIYKLLKSKDEAKDQTYFLWTLTQEKLPHILFPVGGFNKSQVRELAFKFDLPTAQRRESQGICFIPDRDVSGFLRRYAHNLTESGPIQTVDGKIIGQHDGLINYTIGQRERLGLGGPNAYYVVRLNSKTNTLVVGEDKDLFQKELVATELNWIVSDSSQFKAKNIGARIRHGHPIEPCEIKQISDSEIKVVFKYSVRAITPGQSIVFYAGREVLGGGIIQ